MSNYIATKGRGKGQWWPTELTPWFELPPYGNKESKPSANLYCPECGTVMGLMNHIIDSAGQVHPSVVEPAALFPQCPNGACGKFHQNVILDGWTATPNPRTR